MEIKTSGFVFTFFFIIVGFFGVVFFFWQMEIANIQYEYLFTSIIDVQFDYMRKINSGNSLGSSIC